MREGSGRKEVVDLRPKGRGDVGGGGCGDLEERGGEGLPGCPGDCRGSDGGRAAHAHGAEDQGWLIVREQPGDGFDSSAEDPRGVATAVNERETEVDHLAGEFRRGLLDREFDDRGDT